jgi:hypothetical protein
MNGDVLSDYQIAAMSAEERLALARRLRPTHTERPPSRESTSIRRIRLWVSAAAALALSTCNLIGRCDDSG